MARTKKWASWSYKAGRRGTNRVRAFQDKTNGQLRLEWWQDGQRRSKTLAHGNKGLAEKDADLLAAELLLNRSRRPEDLRLQQLFEIYLGEVTPSKTANTRSHDHMAAKLFLRAFGAKKKVTSLTQRDWDAFIRQRSNGTLSPRGNGRAVGNRTVAYDLKFLGAVCRWAKRSKLISSNPLDGLTPPREPSPRRPVMSEERYRAMLAVAGDVEWRFETAFVLAHETGHRRTAIARLKWSDVGDGVVLWQKQNDKIGHEHSTPLTNAAEHVLAAAKLHRCSEWVLPAPHDHHRPVPKERMRTWWRKAERRAGLERIIGLGWHSLRRKFATDLKDVPLVDLCALGGWKSATTVISCYQQPDEDTMRKALRNRGLTADNSS